MCEYKVYWTDDKPDAKPFAFEIMFAANQNGKLILSNIVGESIVLKDSMIVEVNTVKERLRVARVPLLSLFIRFTELYSVTIKDKSKLKETEKAWRNLVDSGEDLLKAVKERDIKED